MGKENGPLSQTEAGGRQIGSSRKRANCLSSPPAPAASSIPTPPCPPTLVSSHSLSRGYRLGTSDSSDRKADVKQEGDRHLSDHSSVHRSPCWARGPELWLSH